MKHDILSEGNFFREAEAILDLFLCNLSKNGINTPRIGGVIPIEASASVCSKIINDLVQGETNQKEAL